MGAYFKQFDPQLLIGVFLVVFMAVLSVFKPANSLWSKLCEYGFVALLGALGFGGRRASAAPSVGPNENVTVEAEPGVKR